MSTQSNYMAHAYAELCNDVKEMNAKNLKQTTKTRQMTEEEKEQIFGGNPDYIKNITSNDGKHWTYVNWILLNTEKKFTEFLECVCTKCRSCVYMVHNITGKTFPMHSNDCYDCDFSKPIMIYYDLPDKELIQNEFGDYFVSAPVAKETESYE